MQANIIDKQTESTKVGERLVAGGARSTLINATANMIDNLGSDVAVATATIGVGLAILELKDELRQMRMLMEDKEHPMK